MCDKPIWNIYIVHENKLTLLKTTRVVCFFIKLSKVVQVKVNVRLTQTRVCVTNLCLSHEAL